MNKKIDIHKLNNTEEDYNYLLEEIQFKKKKVIKFIQFCRTFKLCSTAYLLTTNEYTGITVKENDKNKWIEVSFKTNAIETQKINISTEEHFKADPASSFSIFLEKDTPQSEVNKITVAFVDLLKMYGINKKNTLE
ncbi:hypothetical protein ABW636_06525 [Aquimarina sp. 2201CG1-2-11]|uniref:hypothetical protein n=1 Tax=Aquimarina discodermiae TaxID=3231043 RepID=UPI003461B6C1